MAIASRATQNQWKEELNALIRGASGGFLFGIPLLYTMEVWWVGSAVAPVRLLMALVLTFTVVFMLNRTSGFRRSSDTHASDAAMDTVEALAIGIVCTGVMLVLLREITPESALRESLGKLIYESVPFTLGVALANQYLAGSPQGDDKEAAEPQDGEETEAAPQSQDEGILNATLADVGATMLGGLIIGFNIAPTDEVTMISAAVSGRWLLAIVLASLVISYGIVFAAGFGDQQKRHQQIGLFQHPLTETLMSYGVSLLVALGMLVFFRQLTLDDPWPLWLSQTLVLGLPTTIGGAAGRLTV